MHANCEWINDARQILTQRTFVSRIPWKLFHSFAYGKYQNFQSRVVSEERICAYRTVHRQTQLTKMCQTDLNVSAVGRRCVIDTNKLVCHFCLAPQCTRKRAGWETDERVFVDDIDKLTNARKHLKTLSRRIASHWRYSVTSEDIHLFTGNVSDLGSTDERAVLVRHKTWMF